MTFPLPIPDPLRQAVTPGARVLLGLSGGVDSAVALVLLQELGCEVACVTFKNFCYGDAEVELSETSCCSLEAIDDARRLAYRFGSQHWVHDLSEPFSTAVIEPFIAEYTAARTPNPCLACNGDVRFPALVALARRQGCDLAATGHYARIEAADDGARLLRGLDPAKDQSYFLHRLDRALLPSLVFPLGWYTKTDIRRAAAELELPVAEKRDSQEICFVPDDDRSFLFDADGGTEPGDIVLVDGTVVGRHRGLVHYTVGQRRGLGVAAAEPLYVLRLEIDGNRLVIGPQPDLAVTCITADRFSAMAPAFPSSPEPPFAGGLVARIRHRHPGSPVVNWRLTGRTIEVELAEPAFGVAPGQGLVLYDGDRVLGGGRILDAR